MMLARQNRDIQQELEGYNQSVDEEETNFEEPIMPVFAPCHSFLGMLGHANIEHLVGRWLRDPSLTL